MDKLNSKYPYSFVPFHICMDRSKSSWMGTQLVGNSFRLTSLEQISKEGIRFDTEARIKRSVNKKEK
jgi:hypothetical protein